jgi:DNA-binding IclR family transcriptional regulator
VQLLTGSVAAPLFNRDGNVPASVCLIMRASGMRDEVAAAAATEELLAVARTISTGLGWRPGAEQGLFSAEAARSSRLQRR